MQTIQWNPIKLRSLLGLEDMANDSAFLKLGKYMSVREMLAQQIIRHAGAVETESHVLEKGLVGMYYNGELIRLYFPGDMFLDFDSYREQVPSRYEYKVLHDALFTVLTYENEQKVLKEIPEFKQVSEFLISKVRNSNEQWTAFSQLPYEDRLRKFEERIPGLRYFLKIKDLGSLLGISPRSVTRLKSKDDPKPSKKDWKSEVSREISYPFHAVQHNQALEIEQQAICWASELHALLRNPEEVKAVQKCKLALLSTFLYPEIEFPRGVWISKLYLWLFYLDDLTDRMPTGQKEQLWKGLQTWLSWFWEDGKKQSPFLPFRLIQLCNAFEDLWRNLWELEGVNEIQVSLIREEIEAYVFHNKVEAGFKDQNFLPDRETYLKYKPYFSGAQLAVSLSCLELKEGMDEESEVWQKTERLRALGAELIFLDNDLISFSKETKLGDSMNYLSLLRVHHDISLEEAKRQLLEFRQTVLEEFIELNSKWLGDFNPQNHLILQHLKYIKYKISGSAHWSLNVSNRYDLSHQ